MDHDATNFSICSHLFHHRFEAYFQQAKHRARRLVRGFFICFFFLRNLVPGDVWLGSTYSRAGFVPAVKRRD